MSEFFPWTEWTPISPLLRIEATTLAEWLDGGQAFRWNRRPDGAWRGIWANHLVELTLRDEMLVFRVPLTVDPASASASLNHYLALEPAQTAALEALPWRSDPHLAQCIQAFPGLRILRQPFGETLLCFLCSATKQIVQIKQMVELLARRFGKEISPDQYRLPNWQELAVASEASLRECLLGFRARYIHQTALFLAEHPTWLTETEALPYMEAKDRLCHLPGVGEKVADCVLLFGAGRMEAFPVDVWIIKTMVLRYGLNGWRTPQIAHFGRVHFGSGAGLAQQYLFAWERRTAKLKRSSPELVAPKA